MCPWTGRYEDTFFLYIKSQFILKSHLYCLKSLFRDTEWTFSDTERPFRVTERTFGVTEQRLYMPTAYNIMPFNTL